MAHGYECCEFPCLLDPTCSDDGPDGTLPPEIVHVVLSSSAPSPGYFIAGGLAGAVSRTATAPFDRLKVYLIAQTGPGEGLHAVKKGAVVEATKKSTYPLIEATRDLWKAGGIRSLFAGNGLNVIKIIPESSIKFGSYEAAKLAFARFEGHNDPKQISGVSKFIAGGIGGMIAHRMQCETVPGGLRGNALIRSTALAMFRTPAWPLVFYRGLPMGLAGMFPYSAIDLATFEALKRRITAHNISRRRCTEGAARPGGVMTAAMGAFSGALSASIVYPVNVLRTRLQAQGTAIHPAVYTGVWDVTMKTLKGEGVRGLFRGLTPNLLKVVPSVSITYVVYEYTKTALGLP
ncbi:MAG: hypothetical protein M1829_004739 [Trizodia sp. TS-e1964]|nr:MAG: hypothetical protein M1829_004739 [Trizodia sp. TS-e1964]